MNGTKKARRSSSISNRTNVYGTMPGNVSSVGKSISIRSAYKRAVTPLPPTSIFNFFPTPNGDNWNANKDSNAYYYLVINGMLSKNPAANSFKRAPRPSSSKLGGQNYNNMMLS